MTTLLAPSRRQRGWHGGRSVAVSAAVAVGVALAANAVVFAAGWDEGSRDEAQPSFAPPGWVVGAVWVVLFAAAGAARALILRSTAAGAERAAWRPVVLIAACALYPLYTAGLEAEVVGLVGNVATAGIAAWAVAGAWRHSRLAAALLALPLPWLAFASAITVESIRLR